MKAILWLCGIFLLLMGVLSIVFFQQRVMYSDSAYNAFYIINSEFFETNHSRYGLYITQIIPLLCLKLGCSVVFFLKLYSISYLLIAGIVFCILIKIKQPKLAVLLSIMQVIAYRETWFLAFNETTLCIAMVLLLAGVLQYFQQHKITLYLKLFYLALPIFIAIYSHPMAIVLIAFIIVFYAIQYPKQSFQNVFISILLLMVIFTIKTLCSNSSSYEQELYQQIANFKPLLQNFKSLYSVYFFCGNMNLANCFTNLYFIPTIIFLIVLAVFLIQKKYVLGSYYLFSTVGFWLLLIIIFNRGDGNIFMEKNFTPWVFVCLYPLCFLEIKKKQTLILKLSFMAIVCVLTYSLYGIYKVSPIYKNRIVAINNLLTVKNIPNASKLLIQDSTVDFNLWQNTWALPYETLLYSKVNCKKTMTAKMYNNEESINKELYRDDIFLSADFFPVDIPNWQLNSHYFILEKSKYVLIIL